MSESEVMKPYTGDCPAGVLEHSAWQCLPVTGILCTGVIHYFQSHGIVLATTGSRTQLEASERCNKYHHRACTTIYFVEIVTMHMLRSHLQI